MKPATHVVKSPPIFIVATVQFPGDSAFRVGGRLIADRKAATRIAQIFNRFLDEFADMEVPAANPSELTVESGPFTCGELDREESETNIAEICFMMGSGQIPRDGTWYLFSLKNKNGVRRGISVRWFDGGWEIDAHWLGSTKGWGATCRKVSRSA